MDTGRGGSFSRLQHMGLYQLLWSLSDVLRLRTWFPSLRCVLGGLAANISPVFRRHLFRASHRLRVVQGHRFSRLVATPAGHVHDLVINKILALGARTRRVRGFGEWLGLLSHAGGPVNILYQEEVTRNRNYSIRKFNGGTDLSCPRPKTSASNRISLDRENLGFCHVGSSSDLSLIHEAKITPEEIWAPGRVACLQRVIIHTLHNRWVTHPSSTWTPI